MVDAVKNGYFDGVRVARLTANAFVDIYGGKYIGLAYTQTMSHMHRLVRWNVFVCIYVDRNFVIINKLTFTNESIHVRSMSGGLRGKSLSIFVQSTAEKANRGC